MTGALLLSFALLGQHGETTDPVLVEVRALRSEVRECHDAIVKLTAAVEARKQQIDEDHVTMTNPNTGLTVRLTRAESSLTRHSWVLYTTATSVGGLYIGVAGAWLKKRAGLSGRNGGGNGQRK